jgi:hypothetical protein
MSKEKIMLAIIFRFLSPIKELWTLTPSFFFCAFGSCIFFSYQSVHADEIPLAKALGIIQSLEVVHKNAQWQIEQTRGGFGSWEDYLQSFKPDPNYFVVGTVKIGFTGGRFYFEAKSLSPWVNGTHPFYTNYQKVAFDGEVFKNYEVGRPGVEPPKPGATGTGVRSKGRQERTYEVVGTSLGVGCFPPFTFPRLERLSVFLQRLNKEQKPVRVTEDQAGLWQIAVHDDNGFDLVLDYEPSKGGAISRYAWYTSGSKEPFRVINIELKKYADDFWGPYKVYDVLRYNKMLTKVVYENVKIDQQLERKDFDFDFPPNTMLTDHIERKIYRVGAGPINDQEAIKNYMKANDLYPDKHPSSIWRRTVGIFFIVGLPIILGLILVCKKMWKRTTACLFIGMGFLFIGAGGGQVFGSPLEVGADQNERLPLSQCGFNVTVFALEYFRVPDYSVKAIELSLQPSDKGISMEAIKNTLQAYGLKVEARMGVTVKDLSRSLKSDVLAILPVPVRPLSIGGQHYLVALRHSVKGPLLVDVPLQIYPLEEALSDKDLESTKGLVLYVQNGEKRQAGELAKAIEFSPTTIDLGNFPVYGPKASKPVKKSFEIRNTGRRPVIVTNVASSCGCIADIDWQGGLLVPGEGRRVSFFVIPGAFGSGPQTRFIQFALSDGSKKEFNILGIGKDPESVRSLVVDPRHLFIDCSVSLARKQSIKRALVIKSKNGKLPKIVLRSSVPWMTPKISKWADTNATAEVLIVPPGNLLEIKQMEGQLTVFAEDENHGIPVDFHLFIEDFFVSKPTFVQFKGKTDEMKRVELIPKEGRAKNLRCLRTAVEPEGLKVNFQNLKNGHVQLSIERPAGLSPRYYHVKCFLESEQGEKGQANLLVVNSH